MNAQDTVVFVTGASAGFGAAIVRRFAEGGARVVAAARRADRLEALAGAFPPGQILPLTLDVGDRAAVDAAVADLPERFSRIDLLVNNAGLALGLSAADEAALDDWDRMIRTNCAGLAYVTRAILPGMRARRRGHVVNIGSVAGRYPYPGGNLYGATKAFVHQFSLNLRSDLHGSGVRVTCVEPGLCSGTEFSQVRFAGDTARAEAVYTGLTALGPEDIAETVAWVFAQPAHVNVNLVEMMPTAQSAAAFQVWRGMEI